jgi:hypothetical protein
MGAKSNALKLSVEICMNELLKEVRIILKYSLNKYSIRVRIGLV